MIILTNTASQELAPGQSLVFNLEILHTGCAECYRAGSGAISMRMQNAIYDINISANIGSTTAATTANLTAFLNGSPMTETTMLYTTTTVGDLNTVSRSTGVRTCCGPETITFVNNGDTTIVVEQPLVKIRRVA